MDTNGKELRRLIEKHLRIAQDKICADSSLYHDFGVAGLDGWEFMEIVSQRFGIDMTGFRPARYFGHELPWNPFLSLMRGFFRRDHPLFADVQRLPIRHLEEVIKKRVWYDPLAE